MKNKKEPLLKAGAYLAYVTVFKGGSDAVIRQIVPYSILSRRERKSLYTSPLFVSFKISWRASG